MLKYLLHLTISVMYSSFRFVQASLPPVLTAEFGLIAAVAAVVLRVTESRLVDADAVVAAEAALAAAVLGAVCTDVVCALRVHPLCNTGPDYIRETVAEDTWPRIHTQIWWIHGCCMSVEQRPRGVLSV